MLDYKSIFNGEAKLIAKNKKLIFWLFFACFSYSNGKAKQNAKMHFLSHKCYSYVSLKRTKTNKVGPIKKISQLNLAIWKKITSKPLKKIKHLFIPL